MQTYKIEVKEVLRREIEIEASDEQAAIERIEDLYGDSAIRFDRITDFSDAFFEVVK